MKQAHAFFVQDYTESDVYTWNNNYTLIVALESDTRKYHEFIAAYCYKCKARVTMLEAMNE